jgi:hypothetical protein
LGGRSDFDVIDPLDPLHAWWDLVHLQQRASADVLAMMAARLQGRRLTLPIGGRRLALVVRGISVRAAAGPDQVRIDLHDLDYDGLRLDAVELAAEELRLRPLPTATLIASRMRVDGRTSLAHLVRWLDRHVPDWSLTVGSDRRVEATRLRRPAIRLSVEPAIDDHRVHLQVRAVRWRRLRLAVPRALRVRRTLQLPVLPFDALVVAARRDGEGVDLRLTIPTISVGLPAPLFLPV